MDASTIVKRIRALSGITRKELAELAEVSPSTVGRIERGTLDPTWGTLSRILESTGYRINGDTVVSAGDSTAVAAALPIFESILRSSREASSAVATSALAPITAMTNAITHDLRQSVTQSAVAAAQGVVAPSLKAVDASAEAMTRWRGRWSRAGWLSENPEADDMVTLAVCAGNAAKLARRNVARRNVVAEDGWRALAAQLGEAGFDYAVSGLVATREDRATATAVNPMIYVESPSRIVEELDLKEARPGSGVLLMVPGGDELKRTEVDGDIRFVSRAQGVLDAFAGSGREPDKAEDTLRQLLAVAA